MRSQSRLHRVDHAQHLAKRRVPRLYRYVDGAYIWRLAAGGSEGVERSDVDPPRVWLGDK